MLAAVLTVGLVTGIATAVFSAMEDDSDPAVTGDVSPTTGQAGATAPAALSPTPPPASLRLPWTGQDCQPALSGPYGAVTARLEVMRQGEPRTTTCGFARNVRDAYLASGQAGQALSLEAYSPRTGESVPMTCVPQQHSVECTGGVAAAVILYDPRTRAEPLVAERP